MTRMKIGIRYCGGCNPNYERVEVVERVQSRMKERFLFLRYDQKDVDVLISINGCLRACANENLNPSEVPHFSVKGERDFGGLLSWLMGLNKG